MCGAMIKNIVENIVRMYTKINRSPVKFIKKNTFFFRLDNSQKVIKIALVGKYTQLTDAYASVSRSLIHAAAHINHKVAITVMTYYINIYYIIILKKLIYCTIISST